MQHPDFVLIYEGTVLTADGKPAARTNSLEGRRETDLQDKPLDGRRETDQQADNAGASERETQRCPKPPAAGSTGNRAHQHRHLECGLEESRPTPFLGTENSQAMKLRLVACPVAAVTVATLPTMPMVIRPIEPRDQAEVRAELHTHWHSNGIWSLGRLHQADQLPGFVAEVDGVFAGLLTLNMVEGGWQCEVITLSSRSPAHGVGAALLAAAEEHARNQGCKRIYLTTTNDNAHAIRFYQRRGWRISALYKGIVDRVRQIEPSYPLLGLDGIQIRDEIEFERWLVDGIA